MGSTREPAIDAPRVFISYAHESESHQCQVLALGELLRRQLGIDARLDLWDEHCRRDWAQWAIEQFDNADFVLAIASPAFRDRADGRTAERAGWGAQFEGAILRNKMTQDRATWISRILPVVLPGNTIDDIPEFLLPYSATHYVIKRLTPDGIADLRRALTQQPRHPLPPLGAAPPPLPEEDTTFRPGPAAAPPADRPRRAGNSVRIAGRKNTVGTIIAGDYHDHQGGGPDGSR
jgi:hypothetical protein